MSRELSNEDLLIACRGGDDAAAEAIFRRYEARLLALVRSRLSRKLARRLDPEDVVLSAYRSFFVATRDGRVLPDEADDLWSILLVITLRKLARQVRRHRAKVRSIESEQDVGPEDVTALLACEPVAEHAAMLGDEVERILAGLDETARETVVRTLRGEDPGMIAVGLNISERSVRRALDRVYERLGARPVRRGELRRESRPERALLMDWGSEPPRSDKDYRIERMIGSGAFSKVYAATELATGRRVAVKWLRKAFWRDSRAAAAFARERDLVRRVDHPGVLKVAAWGRSRSGGVFLVMDLIEGVPLDRWRTTINPEVDQASVLRVVTSLVDALCAVHVQGVVHGDLKPANVLVTHDGRCVVCDFGFGHRCSDTVLPPIGGTAGYLAPEQVCDSFGPITPRTDVHGLGATIYFLLTGQAPWRGRDVGDVVAKTISGESPLAPTETLPGFAEGWSAVVRRALSKEPGERFESIAAMGQALRQVEEA